MILSLLLAAAPLSVDTLKSLDIEEVVVVATPKETERLRRLPVSTSIFDGETLKRRQIKSICDLSSYAPGFYMPDYGSRLTSACYIRGIGSRINTPAVGLYVDNVPYLDKSAYDFQFLGIDRVDILRGPQGTLYGRNTMGGLVRVYTADPLSHHGTELSLGYTGHTQGRRAAFTTYLHPANKMGLSIGGYYDGASGHFTNSYTGKKQDGTKVPVVASDGLGRPPNALNWIGLHHTNMLTKTPTPIIILEIKTAPLSMDVASWLKTVRAVIGVTYLTAVSAWNIDWRKRYSRPSQPIRPSATDSF